MSELQKEKKETKEKKYKKEKPRKDSNGTPPPLSEKAQLDPPPYTKPALDILLPSVEEVGAHLKLLHAFSTLHADVETNFGASGLDKEKIWQLFVTVAVRRFNVFVSALRWKFSDDVNGLVTFVQQTLPPIDILMVWHSFLLNPVSFSTNFIANNFKAFALCPFPVVDAANHLTCDWLEQEVKVATFTLSVSQECSQQFTNLIMSYYTSQDINEEFAYNPLERFSITSNVPVCCPHCDTKWGEVPLYMEQTDFGFANSQFYMHPTTRCRCLRIIDMFMTHETLRRLLFQKDTADPAVSSLMAKNHHNRRESKNIEQFDVELKQLAQRLPFVLELTDLRAFRDQLSPVTVSVLRDYNEINLISATIPTANKVVIREYLVACVMRQGRFIVQMVEEFFWLYSERLTFTIEEAIGRYKNFFSLMKTSPHILVPTLDIDLVWHTHQLSQNRYFEFSKQVAGTIIDHNDKIEQNRLDNAFQKTCKLYRRQFKANYAICHCEYCIKNRSINWFKKEKGPTPLVKGKDYNNNHISAHNSVLIPTPRGLRAWMLSSKYFRVKPYKSEAFEGTFVTDPHNPTNFKTLPLYENGCQMNSFDTVSACTAGDAGLARGRASGTTCSTAVTGGTLGGQVWNVSSGTNTAHHHVDINTSGCGTGGCGSGGGCGGGACGGGNGD